MIEVLRLAVMTLDMVFLEVYGAGDEDGCQQTRIREVLGITEEEFDFIKGEPEEDDPPKEWYEE